MPRNTYPENIDELIRIRVETGTPLKWIGNTLTPNEFPHNQFEQGEPVPSEQVTVEELKKLGFVGIYRSII